MKREARKRKWVKRLHWCSDSIQGLLWMAAAIATLYYSNFFRTCMEHPDIDQMFFTPGLMGIGINMTLMFYMALYLPYVKGIEEDYETYCPQLIKVMAISGLLTFFA